MMPMYTVLIDYANSWEDKDIQVLQSEIEASSAKEAMVLAQKKLDSGTFKKEIGEDKVTYLWDIIEEDKIERSNLLQ